MGRYVVPKLSLVKRSRQGYGGRMIAKLKHIMPLAMRTRVKRLGYHLLDIARPITAKRVPSRAQTSIGGGDFAGVGDGFFALQKDLGLTADMHVLEPGCGQGRMARPMVGWLTGEYHGFDIDEAGIAWCQKHYADAPNFHFTHTDVFNARYNPTGQIQAQDLCFPSEDAAFDWVILTSVFTHMFEADIDRYMAEIVRVMKPGATCLISWYLWEEGTSSDIMDFRYAVNDVSRTTLKQNPEAAMAFDMAWVRALYARHGLTITKLERGHWAGGAGRMGIQDLVVAELG
ncbi:class I SAM-dependent methyltransferase [Litorimonas sp. RW-G-Af-16]|uniref:class I SAM-dependent methyltransferase n=1 Tax=Litorimonas sp. RW-G-Af-16 TaxID=3241168 RepID=UPI00390C9F65